MGECGAVLAGSAAATRGLPGIGHGVLPPGASDLEGYGRPRGDARQGERTRTGPGRGRSRADGPSTPEAPGIESLDGEATAG